MNLQPSKAIKIDGRKSMSFVAKYGTLIGMGIMLVAFSLSKPQAFPSPSNLINILNQSSLTAIIAGGLTLALIVGEMDLSVGYNASLAGVLVTGLIVGQHFPVWLAILATILIGALVGFVNALIVTKLKVNSVIATLGTGSIVQGITFAYSQGVPIASGVPAAFKNISLGRTLSIPNNILIMLGVLIILWILVNRTEWGQQLQATGGNIEASRLSGIRVDNIKTMAFMITGAAAALTGILLASLIGSGTAHAADGYLMASFAAVFLGSATLKDGEFHIIGTLIGVLIIQIGFNGMAIFGVPIFFQDVFRGTILILAVGLSTVARRLSRS
ncbi:MAG: ABC transporter permease [Veillonellaceae bacterium]|nr:ABC transporter permease [Veillonellaceae bacterium]